MIGNDELNFPIFIRKGVRSCSDHPTSPNLFPFNIFFFFFLIRNKKIYYPFNIFHLSFKPFSLIFPLTKFLLLSKNLLEVKAMDKEMRGLKKRIRVGSYKKRKIVRCKWIFNIKCKADGTLERHTARLVAMGYTRI